MEVLQVQGEEPGGALGRREGGDTTDNSLRNLIF